MCKAGREASAGNVQRDETVLSLKPTWSEAQIAEAVHFVRYMNEYFGKQEAVAVILLPPLFQKFHISIQDLTIPETDGEKVGLES